MNIQKGFSNILGILLILIVIGGGAYIYMQNSKKEIIQETVYREEEKKSDDTPVKTENSQKSNEEKITENATGIINAVYSKDNKNYLDIDYIELNKNWTPGSGTGSVYTNTNTKIRTFEISSAAKFFIDGKPKNFLEFKDVYNNPESYQRSNPWQIVVVDNLVVEIREYYIP